MRSPMAPFSRFALPSSLRGQLLALGLVASSSAPGALSFHAQQVPIPDAPQIEELNPQVQSRSGFLEITGSGFGASGDLSVDGEQAIVATWTEDRIVGYVPEIVGAGAVEVQVISRGRASNAAGLEVTMREPAHRQLWRLRMDASYSAVRPSVGADGTVYAVDVYDRLYAVAADGELLWVAHDAGSKGLGIGLDGTIYTGNEDWIKAFDPSGAELWTFHQNPRAFVLQDVAVGPDGNVFAIGTSGLGVFSLTPDGDLRWAVPEAYDRPFIGYTEMVFGPSPYGEPQLYFSANRHTRALLLSDGTEVFSIGTLLAPMAVSPLDGTLHTAYAAYDTDGTQLWQFHEFLNGHVSVGQSGVHYNSTSMVTSRLFAANADGSERWRAELPRAVYECDVNPTEQILVLGEGNVLSVPGAVYGAASANGSVQWRHEFAPEDTHIYNSWTGRMGFNHYVDSSSVFSSDGAVAYLHTAIAPGGLTTDRCFLHAIELDPALGSPSTLLRSVDIELRGRSRGSGVAIDGTVWVEDEGLAAVSGVTVNAEWTLPDQSSLIDTATTNGQGVAQFTVNGEGGFYTLTILDLVKEGYRFDADYSELSRTIAWF